MVRNYTITGGLISGIRVTDIDMGVRVAQVNVLSGGIYSESVSIQYSSGVAGAGFDFRTDIYGFNSCWNYKFATNKLRIKKLFH